MAVKEAAEYYKSVVYILCDLICDFTNYCVWIWVLDETSVCDKS